MPRLKTNYPDALVQRLLSEVPAAEQDGFTITALEEALDRRRGVHKAAAAPAPTEKKMGRPPKGEGRIGISLYLEAGYHAEINAIAEASGVSKSDVANAILRRAYRAGMFLPPDEQ